jgi:hypothetical protein
MGWFFGSLMVKLMEEQNETVYYLINTLLISL